MTVERQCDTVLAARMVFRICLIVAALLLPVTTPLAAAQGAAGATITAQPNPVPGGFGTGSTTLSWSTGGPAEGRVMVSTNGGIETLFAKGDTGATKADWINSNASYEFRLYGGTQPSTLLAKVTVNRAPMPPGPALQVTPGPASSNAGADLATIAWTTGDTSSGEVFVSKDGEPERSFAEGRSGSSTVDWLRRDSTYEFRLYSTTRPRVQLAEARLSPVTAASEDVQRSRSLIASSPNPVPAGLGGGSTEITWTVGGGDMGQVLMSVDGGSPTVFASGPSGRQTATGLTAGSTYAFTLYGPHDVMLASTTVTRRSLLPLTLGAIALALAATVAWLWRLRIGPRKSG